MSLTFLPWVRQGLAAAITPGATTARPQVSIEVGVVGGGNVPVPAELYGPGDVLALDRRAIIHTHPTRGAALPKDELCAVDFERADLPWLFSPQGADADDRVRPWLVLVVLERRAQARLTPGVRPELAPEVLTLEGEAVRELPPLSESWAWAHAQIAGATTTSAAELSAALRDAPQTTSSRLIAPRKLVPGRPYLACLVPAYEVGRRAGLGQDVGTGLADAWRGDETRLELPVYASWPVEVSDAATFAELAARLAGRALPREVGRARVEVQPVAGSAEAPFTTEIPGLFAVDPTRPTGPELTRFGAALVQLQSRPTTLAPPHYGDRHAAPGTPWSVEANADLTARAAAALGTQVIEAEQEALVEAAWDLHAARAPALPRGELRGLITERLAERLAKSPRAAQVVSVVKQPATAARAPKLAATTRRLLAPARSARAVTTGSTPLVLPAVVLSQVPHGPSTFAFDPRFDPRNLRAALDGAPGASTFKLVGEREAWPFAQARFTVTIKVLERVTRPRPRLPTRRELDPITRRPIPVVDEPADTTPEVVEQWVNRTLSNAVIGVPWHLAQPGFADNAAATAFRSAARALQARLDALPRPAVFLAQPLVRLKSAELIGELMRVLLPPSGPTRDPSGLAFETPMWRSLHARSSALVLPGLDQVPADSVSVLSLNARFAEAFLLGLNHELSRELAWRGFPLEGSPTFFQSLFTTAVEVPPIAEWQSLGGGLVPALRDATVLLVRGALVRAHPHVIVTASKGAAHHEPLFRVTLDADTLLLGFPVPRIGLDAWTFTLQEQPTSPAFRTARSPGLLRVSDVGLPARAGAAEVAAQLLRRPSRLHIPATTLLARS